MPNTQPTAVPLTDQLKLGTGFHDRDRALVLDRLAGLERRLGTHKPGSVELELSIKERDGADQHVTLDCRVAELPRLVATSKNHTLSQALSEVRDELIRQLDDQSSRREPRHNRHLREAL